MSIWTSPSPSDFDRWEALILKGDDPSHAAKELGFGGSSTFKRTDPVKHAEVLQVWRERRDADDVKLARDTLREIAEAETSPLITAAARVSAATTLGKAAGMFEADKLEISGPQAGPLEVDIAGAAARLREKLAALLDDGGEGDAATGDR